MLDTSLHMYVHARVWNLKELISTFLTKCSSALEIDFVETIVKEVLKILQAICKVESSQSSFCAEKA